MMMGFFSERGLEIVIAAAAVSVVALVGGLLTDVGPWYESLRFPRLRPPNWLFGPAWTVIFILIAAAGVVAWESAEDPATRFRLVALFFVNGVLNLLWSPLFFKMRRPDWALYNCFCSGYRFWFSSSRWLKFRVSPQGCLLPIWLGSPLPDGSTGASSS